MTSGICDEKIACEDGTGGSWLEPMMGGASLGRGCVAGGSAGANSDPVFVAVFVFVFVAGPVPGPDDSKTSSISLVPHPCCDDAPRNCDLRLRRRDSARWRRSLRTSMCFVEEARTEET